MKIRMYSSYLFTVNVKQRPAVYVKLPENEQVVYPSAFRCLRHVTEACQKFVLY